MSKTKFTTKAISDNNTCVRDIKLPRMVDARITINITVLSNESDVLVNTNYSGYDNKVVTDEELKLFNVTKARLNKGMRVELGKIPNDIYLKNPTPYGDLFNKYDWEEMTRRLAVQKSKIIDILNEDVVLDTHEHINNTTNYISSKISMFAVIENRISSTWSKNGLPKDEIFANYIIDYGYGKFNCERKWRNESTQNVKMPIGMTKYGFITIKPGQTVVTKLTASKTIVLMKLVHVAQLRGSVIANFAELYGKYHFWAPSVKTIMKAGNMTNEVITTEILEVRCFTNPRLKMYDKFTGEAVEPPKKKRPQMKIIRNGNMTRVVYIKAKKAAQQKKPTNNCKSWLFNTQSIFCMSA